MDRPSITDVLEEKLSPRKRKASSPKRVVFYGLGGSGKTEIAIRFAEIHRQDYAAVFWVHGMDKTHMQAGFNAISRMVSKGGGDKDEGATANAQSWLSTYQDWLLVIDNADEESAVDVLRREFLRLGMEGDILITRWNSTTCAYWESIEVCDMEPEEAASLLSNIAGRPRPEDQAMQAELLSDLGHLALAIDQASSYILATRITLQECHKWFRTEKSRLLKQYPSTQYNFHSRETVMTTWELSFQRVQLIDPQASKADAYVQPFQP